MCPGEEADCATLSDVYLIFFRAVFNKPVLCAEFSEPVEPTVRAAQPATRWRQDA